jgi:hypothetical protein
MRYRRLPLGRAFDLVNRSRGGKVAPNIGFQMQLTAFELQEFGFSCSTKKDWAGAVSSNGRPSRRKGNKS